MLVPPCTVSFRGATLTFRLLGHCTCGIYLYRCIHTQKQIIKKQAFADNVALRLESQQKLTYLQMIRQPKINTKLGNSLKLFFFLLTFMPPPFLFCFDLNRLDSELTQKMWWLTLEEQLIRWHFFFLFYFIYKYIKREDPQSHKVDMTWTCKLAEHRSIVPPHSGMSLWGIFVGISGTWFCTIKWCGWLDWMFNSCGFVLFFTI